MEDNFPTRPPFKRPLRFVWICTLVTGLIALISSSSKTTLARENYKTTFGDPEYQVYEGEFAASLLLQSLPQTQNSTHSKRAELAKILAKVTAYEERKMKLRSTSKEPYKFYVNPNLK